MARPGIVRRTFLGFGLMLVGGGRRASARKRRRAVGLRSADQSGPDSAGLGHHTLAPRAVQGRRDQHCGRRGTCQTRRPPTGFFYRKAMDDDKFGPERALRHLSSREALPPSRS